jgi:hypothetical protein
MNALQNWIGDFGDFLRHPAAFALGAAVSAALAVAILLAGRRKRRTNVFTLLAETAPGRRGDGERALAARIRRWLGRRRSRRGLHPAAIPVLAALGGCAFAGFLWLISPFAPRPLMQVHPLNCAQARAMGFGNAEIGWPGYFAHLDADKDGISCEPMPRGGLRR